MKTQRLARWGGSVLSPRTSRPCCSARVQALPARSRRFQSSAATLQEEALEKQTPWKAIDMTRSAYAEQTHYERLNTLPSPPVSASLSSAKLSALHARLQLPQRFPLQTLAKCLVHPSADSDARFNNSALATLGHDILGSYTGELILCTYPRLPMNITYAAMKAYVGPDACASIVQEWGIEAAAEPGGEVDPGLLQFLRATPGNADVEGDGTLLKDHQRKLPKTWAGLPHSTNIASISETYFGREGADSTPGPTAMEIAEKPELQSEADRAARERSRVTLGQASTSFVQALFGATYLHCGRDAAKALFEQHIRPRKLDVSRMFYFKMPTRDLARLCAREGFERPVGRILSETGRYTRHPVFVLGVFSGREKLGEGTGGSLDEARIRAAISALKGWYLYSPLKVRVPSDVEGGKGDKEWEPVLIDGGEVIT